MITVRRAEERGAADYGWLDTRHTFSFGDYHDSAYSQYRALRVMNEDRVAPGKGFPTHGHRDMEILTYVISGALEHQDSMGNGSVLHAGDFQKMSAGTGVRHSEFNASETDPVHFYQVWIQPDESELKPSYAERRASEGYENNAWTLVAGPQSDHAIPIHQDARVFMGKVDEGEFLAYETDSARHLWLQVVSGTVAIAEETLEAGDGAAIHEASKIELTGLKAAELLLFDLG